MFRTRYCCTRFCFCEFALRMSGLCAHDIGDVSRRTLHSTSALSSPSRLALGLVITFNRVVAGSSLAISHLRCAPRVRERRAQTQLACADSLPHLVRESHRPLSLRVGILEHSLHFVCPCTFIGRLCTRCALGRRFRRQITASTLKLGRTPFFFSRGSSRSPRHCLQFKLTQCGNGENQRANTLKHENSQGCEPRVLPPNSSAARAHPRPLLLIPALPKVH